MKDRKGSKVTLQSSARTLSFDNHFSPADRAFVDYISNDKRSLLSLSRGADRQAESIDFELVSDLNPGFGANVRPRPNPKQRERRGDHISTCSALAAQIDQIQKEQEGFRIQHKYVKESAARYDAALKFNMQRRVKLLESIERNRVMLNAPLVAPPIVRPPRGRWPGIGPFPGMIFDILDSKQSVRQRLADLEKQLAALEREIADLQSKLDSEAAEVQRLWDHIRLLARHEDTIRRQMDAMGCKWTSPDWGAPDVVEPDAHGS